MPYALVLTLSPASGRGVSVTRHPFTVHKAFVLYLRPFSALPATIPEPYMQDDGHDLTRVLLYMNPESPFFTAIG